MACATTTTKIWFVNNAVYAPNNSCQSLFIPVESIAKQSPAATASVGVPFTYTLTIPVMYDPAGDKWYNNPSVNTLGNIRVTDDLTAAATGAEMTLVGINAYIKGSNVSIPVTNNGDNKHLDFTLPDIPAGSQIVVEVTVVLDDTPTNTAGKQFINTAEWEFSRYIDGTLYSPLPGQSGISSPMTIAEPNLVVTKTSNETALNLGAWATFTIDVQNTGGSDAWNVTVLDQLPDHADTGMCEYDPRTVNLPNEPGLSARIVEADGTTVVKPLDPATHYSVTYNGTPTCQLSLTLTDAAGPIAPDQHLVITYQSRLDSDTAPTADGIALTNVAGATEWFSSDGTHTPRTFARTLSVDGTPGTVDHQDSETVTTALAGYYFQKTVANRTSHASPGPDMTAAPGDVLRYRLRVFNVDETIEGITINDPLNSTEFDMTTFAMVTDLATLGAKHSFNPVTGQLRIDGDGKPLNVPAGSELVIEFDITLKSGLVNGTWVENQAEASATGGFSAFSDDPYVNGISAPGELADATRVMIQTPGPLSKANTQPSAKIGEQFKYLVTIPATPVAVPLYDVRILDTLPSTVDLRFVSANVVSGGAWILSNTGSGTSLIIEDAITGIDIPAGGQAEIEITVELLNTDENNSGLSFNNSASYTYNRANGDDTTQASGGAGQTAAMTVVEPALTATKLVRNVTPGKAEGDPAAGGDTLEYTVRVVNSSVNSAYAYDVNVADMLPPELALIDGSATARINGGSPITLSAPATGSSGELVWGSAGGDVMLDIPPSGTLDLTFLVTVQRIAGPIITNSAWIDWTSLDDDYPGRERTGEGCPSSIMAPNDYCYSVAPATINTLDTNAITKTVTDDTFAEDTSTAPRVVRVGDTATYQLTLKLREGITSNVVVQDVLPAGMQLQGAPVISTSAGANFSYSLTAQPSAGATGTLVWNFGDIDNQSRTPASGIDVLDELIITYTARVVTDAPTAGVGYDASILGVNSASLSYIGGDPASADPLVRNRLNATATVDIRQPVISAITKVDYGTGRTGSGTAADPYQVDIVNDTMKFRLQACNTTGLAPAYNLVITDQLPAELNEGTLVGPVVKIGPGTNPSSAAITPAADYDYTLNARLMSIAFKDSRPINPGECVFVEYDIGFNSGIAPNTTWNNSALVQRYFSLPTQSGREYGTVGPAAVYMRNAATLNAPTKSIALPGAPTTTVTIGEEVHYTITVPGTPINATLTDVAISDTLDPALAYQGATVAGGLTLTDNTVVGSQNVSLTIAQIPAGQQAVITLRARVANSATTDATDVFTNKAAYTYNGVTLESPNTANLTVVEPSITVDKTVAAATPLTAGELLTYTVVLTAAPGPTAYDLVLVDTLSPGLEYELNTATVNGAASEPTRGVDPATGGQTLTWSGGLDIAPGAPVTVTYEVRVRDDVVIGQTMTNTATARWTSLDGPSDYERTGSGTPTYNDYVASDSTSLIIGDTTTFTKTRVSDTYDAADANVRIGDLIEYELRLGLQEGTHTGITVTDTLPTGLQYEGMVSATYFGTVQPTPPAPSASGQTLTWNLGTVINPADGDATNDYLVLRYRVRVLNNDVLAQSPTSQSLANNATLGYTVGAQSVTTPPISASVTVLQPMLTVNKTAAPANGDNVVDAGEVITYTVDISNSGTAPAYDTRLQDTLPAGLRQGGVSTVSITLVNTAVVPNTQTSLAPFNPAYTPATGIAVWNFDNGTANAYTIPPGHTLRVVYTATVDSDVAAGLTLTNTAQATHYYSLDDEEVPPNGSAVYREEYASNTASASVTTATAGVLSKATTQPSAGIGEEFTYTITVPETRSTTALHDVRIYDNLAVGGADLRFVRAELVAPGTGPLAGSVDAATGVVEIRNTDGSGFSIPANGQIQVAVTVKLLDTAKNMTPGLSFTNRAWYTYSNGVTTIGSDPTTGATSDRMTVAHPTLTLAKTGPAPATMRVGTPATFRLDVQNTGASDAWNVTVSDWLPNPTPGGMCDAGVSGVSATIYEADGTTPVLALGAGTHYDTSFTVSGTGPRCEFGLTLKAPAFVAPGQRLIVTYSVQLDADNIHGSTLTNIAGATRWLSADPAGDAYHTYTAALTDGTPGTVDHQDAYSVTVQGAILASQKTVFNVTTNQPGTTATPGDRLRYTITINNTTDVPLSNFSLADELDRLNAAAMFQPGSLAIVSVPAGADTSGTNAGGGAKGTGVLDVRNLNIGANETLSIVFEATLAPVIKNGTVVLNQGQLSLAGTVFGQTDDPNVSGDQNPTETRITSAPAFQVWKTSQDMTGDTAVLMAGDTLRYTITVKNVGNENAVNTLLRDQIPAYTRYVPNSTTLNGGAVADAAAGVSPLQNGMPINAPENMTPGAMRADASATTTGNIATITFDVVINANVLDGTVISNQGLVTAGGESGTTQVEKRSDDPDTAAVDDPTLDVVGNMPFITAQKTVQIAVDNGSPGQVDPGDVLRYTITLNNPGPIPATGVVLIDAVPADTAYVANSVRLNGLALAPDGGASPLIAGIPVNSPTAAGGTLSAGGQAVVTFDVRVNDGVATGTVISNQGTVRSNELPDELTDADGDRSNGYQPTLVVVGDAQQLQITKQVSIVGGETALAGGQLEYEIRVTNIGAVAATNVVITDDLSAHGAGQLIYVDGSGRLNGSSAGVSYAAPVLTGNYSAVYGALQPGGTAVLRFVAQLGSALADNTTVTNTAVVTWNSSQTDDDSVSVNTGGRPGEGALNGQAWHDANFNNVPDGNEQVLADWTVEIYRDNLLLGSTVTDSTGVYRFAGLAPNDTSTARYELRFRAPGAGLNTASLGHADSAFTNGPQRITGIVVTSGSNLQNLNLPIKPNGVVYDSVLRTPIAGATVSMLQAGTNLSLPASCFDDPAQQDQVTPSGGYYKFDLNFSDPVCAPGGSYVIRVTPPASGYVTPPSALIPPASDAATPAFSVSSCLSGVGDAVAATVDYCEAQTSVTAPSLAVPPRTQGTIYYLHVTLDDNRIPGESQIFNNHIPIDPVLDAAVTISKTSSLVNVTRGQLVPYTITVNNTMSVALQDLSIVDRFPPGFKYVPGSARYDDKPLEPVVAGRQLNWDNLDLATDTRHTIKLLLVVGAGVSEGEYVNRAQVVSALTGGNVSGEASATVRVVPDPTFDCTDIIGKVFDDANLNGYQDEGEQGLPGARVVSARGLIARTDAHGRFHITCAAVPNEDRGSNFILKLDDRSLPSGYRVTSENPRVQRVTRGKAIKFNFGAALHRVVGLDIAAGVFEEGSTEMRLQWKPRIPMVLEELRKAPAVLRLSYLADVEDAQLVKDRLEAVKGEIAALWEQMNCCYKLTIETEIFWRRGGPPDRGSIH